MISTSPYIVGEGENMREEILARVVRARKDRQELYKEEDMILPKIFLPQLEGASRHWSVLRESTHKVWDQNVS